MDFSICTVNPLRHYAEFDKAQYDRQTVCTTIRDAMQNTRIDKITPVSPTLWLIETLTPYPMEE